MPYKGRAFGCRAHDTVVAIAAINAFLTTHQRVTPRLCLYHVIKLKLKHPDTNAIIFPNSEEKYEVKFYRLLSSARVNGEISDAPFEDNHCSVEAGGWHGYDTIEEYMVPPNAARYTRNKWQDQPKHPTEIWLEKDTIAVMVRETKEKWDCTMRIASGGYGRAFLYQAARELHDVEKPIVILYLGDHDPKGVDIERCARKGNDKLGTKRTEGLADILCRKEFGWTPERFARQVKWIRVAVTENDLNHAKFADYLSSVRLHGSIDPKTGTRKKGDACAPAYLKKYGNRCLGIEALDIVEPGSLARRLDTAIQMYGVDLAAWEASERKQQREIRNWLRSHPKAGRK